MQLGKRNTLCELWMGEVRGVKMNKKMITVRRCEIADKDHKHSLRQYAHTYHHNNVICIARAWMDLPIDNQMGILAHEIGHLISGVGDHTELEADKVANKFFGIHIRYKGSEYGEHLQYLSLNDTMNVWECVIEHVLLTRV